MDTYSAHALEGASGVELTIALYDGIIRFMHNAIGAVERREADQRRAAVKRAMDIVIHLQATLNKDVGGKPAESLSDFYVAMFALMLQGSQANSKKKFELVIANVRNVRDAWKQVAADPSANQFAANARPRADGRQPGLPADGAWASRNEAQTATSWTA
jgi:flagellar protein FliS